MFSIVIPVHNKAPHIARSINSVLNQSHQDFELLLVNDASTDGSIKEIRKFNDDRIKIFYRNEPGPGGYAARNLGIEMAKYEWIAFLDADDTWSDDHLIIAKNIIDQFEGKTAICTGRNVVNKNSTTIDKWTKSASKTNELIDLEYLLKNVPNRGYPWHTNSMVLPKAKFIESGLFPEKDIRRGGDGIAWLTYLSNGNKIIRHNKPTSTYYKYGVTNQVTSKKDNIELPHPSATITRKLMEESGWKMKRLLKKYTNHTTINRLHAKAVNKKLKFSDFRYLYIYSLSPIMLLKLLRIFFLSMKSHAKI